MKNKLLSLLLCLTMVLSLVPMVQSETVAEAADVNEIQVTFCGTLLKFDQPPVLKEGRTLVPMRGIFEAMGMQVNWDEASQKVTATSADKTIELTIGSTEAFANGEAIALDVPAEIISGRTMVPVRFVAESSGYRVHWNNYRRPRVIIMPDYSPEAYAAIERYNNECYSEDLIDWIINLYDPESGGFYFKKSAKDTVGFLPDREATANCIGMLSRLEIVDSSKPDTFLTKEMQEKMIAFAQAGQSDEDGYWYEEPWGQYIGTGKRDYQQSGASSILKMLGAKPLYKTSSERLAEQKAGSETAASTELFDNKYNSHKDFEKWFNEGLDWTNPYGAGSALLSELGRVRSAGEDYFDLTIKLIESRISPNTGLLMQKDPVSGEWIEEINFDSMSGSYKISSYYGESYWPSMNGKDLTYPYFDKALDSTIKTMLSDEEGYHACDIVNPWALICHILYSQKDVMNVPEYKAAYERYLKKLPEIIDMTTQRILTLKTSDGSYTYYAGKGASGNKGSNHGLCIVDGEMSGASMIAALRQTIFNALFMDSQPIYAGRFDAADIKEKLMAVEPTKKVQPLSEANFTFDDMPVGYIDESCGIRSSLDVQVVDDPVYIGEKSLRIHSPGGVRPVCYFDVGTTNGKGFTLEYDIKFDVDKDTSALMVSEIGSVFFPVNMGFRKNNGNYILTRTTDKSAQLKSTAKWEDYHTVKVVYTPTEDGSAVSEFYVDGTLVDTSDYYKNGYPARPADKNISYVGFRADHEGEFTAYIDNFKFTEHK